MKEKKITIHQDGAEVPEAGGTLSLPATKSLHNKYHKINKIVFLLEVSTENTLVN